MATCEKCGHKPEAKRTSRDARHALYKAYSAVGATICPTCRDYVMKDGHVCETYQLFRDKGAK